MGAMHVAYEQNLSAREIAEIGVKAGCEFDVNS
jgi:ATP-dependent protease HslVU (ClpYQ) peptidase subunit